MMMEPKCRVLQVLGSLLIGGAESRMMDVYRHLDHDAFDFDFLVFLQGEQYYETEIRQLGGKIIKCSPPSMGNIALVFQTIRKILRDGHYNAVHAHTSYFSGVVMLAAKMEGIPVRITHSRTTDTVRTGLSKKAMVALGKVLISKYATIRLAISKDAGDFLFGNKAFEVLPNAIDTHKFLSVSTDTISTLRAKYQIPESAFVIGQIGRFYPMKNHEFTIRWFDSYRKEHPEAFLLLVGDGYLKDSIEETVKQRAIDQYVRFTGNVDNVNEIIHLFDVMLFPSLFEGLGGVVLEAQASGVPTVMSDTLPRETDLGLGLIARCKLDDTQLWVEAVDGFRNIKAPSENEILNAFNQHHYSLDYELSRLCAMYGGEV